MDNREILYISIADFIIQVIFRESQNILFKERLKNDIEFFFEGFISYKTPKKIDFTLEIVELLTLDDIQAIQNKDHFILLYHNLSKTHIKTFYNISVFQFQIIIQNILYKLITDVNGFIFHASACEINKKQAFLFSGPSGAGKSTSVKLLEKVFPILSDDFSIIRKIGSKYYFYQHPFGEKNPVKNKKLIPFVLKKIFFIEKSDYFEITPIKKSEEIPELLIQQLISPNQHSLKNIMFFSSKFKEIYRLSFSKKEVEMINLIKNAI